MGVEVFIEAFSRHGRSGGRRTFSSHELRADALAAAKARVDAALLGLWHHGMGAQELYSRWSRFGEDVTLVPDSGHPVFSAKTYAKTRVQALTGQLCE